MNTQLRNLRTGRFVRSPVSMERYWNRVAQLAGGVHMRSMAEAERMAAQELKLAGMLAEDESPGCELEDMT